jgi:pSer/pThr/pTyr-binding forkhead associated (FHA) protein
LASGEPTWSGAHLTVEGDGVRLEPLGVNEDIFVFITAPTALADGDVLLLGSQTIRFREVGSDPPRTANRGRRSHTTWLPSDVAVLEQLRDHESVRDAMHLWPERTVVVGRSQGDWLFSYDPTMSARHAEVACGRDGTTTIRDLGSRNGVALRARGPRVLIGGQRLSLGGQVLRVDLA